MTGARIEDDLETIGRAGHANVLQLPRPSRGCSRWKRRHGRSHDL